MRNAKIMRRDVAWFGGENTSDLIEYYDSPSAYVTLKGEIRHLEKLEMTTNWHIFDNETGKLLASKFPETIEERAKNLYKELKNYAKVAKELGVHPTTARKWVKEND